MSDLYAWGLQERLPSLFAVLKTTHQRYLAVYTPWVKGVKASISKQSEQTVRWSAAHLARTQEYHALEEAWSACSQATFFYQQTESLSNPSSPHLN